MRYVKRLALGGVALCVILVLILVPAIVVLNGRLSSEGWDNRSFAELEAAYGPSRPSFTEGAIWVRELSPLGVPIATKGMRVQFERDPATPSGMGVAINHRPFWIFYDFLFLNMVYEPGFRSGVFCFTSRFRCDFWI